MTHEIPTFVKIAVATGGAALALSGTPALSSSQDNPTNTNPGTHREWQIQPCPPGFKAPWEYVAPDSKPTSLTDEITLVSVVPPKSTPNPNHLECWGPVEVPNTHTEWRITGCPKDFRPPWDPAPIEKLEAFNNDVTLVSMKKTEPKPTPNRLECWGPVEVPNSQTNPGPDTTQQS